MKREYGTNGNNGTNGRKTLGIFLPFVPLFPFVPYSLFIVVLLVCGYRPIAAQSGNDAALRVIVRDPAGAAVRGARLTLTDAGGAEINGETDARGEAVFRRLATGNHRLKAAASGFASQQMERIEIRAGLNQLEIVLVVADVKEELAVKQDEREARTDRRGPGFTRILTEEQIAQLPDDPEEMQRVLEQMAGPGSTIRVNGFRGGKLPHKSQIRQIRFRLTAYSAEDHDEGFILIDILTRPALGNWYGMMNLGFRDEALNARHPAAPRRAPEQMRRYSLNFGGPLQRERTSLNFSAYGYDSYDAKTIVAALPQGAFSELARRPSRALTLTTRVDHALNKTHTLAAEYQRSGTRQENLGVGDYDLPERAYSFEQTEHRLRLSENGPLGKRFFQELRLQASWLESASQSVSNAPAIVVLNAFSSGGAGFESSRKSREVEASANFDFGRGNHGLRAGVMFETSRLSGAELRNGNGTFTFASLDAFRSGRPTTWTRREGRAEVGLDQHQFGWYLQDDWRLHKSFSLSLGLRHEFQNDLTDRNNFAPRAGFAWSPFKNGKTTVRAGAGVFYQWFGADLREQLLRVNGRQQREIVILNPGYPDPYSGGAGSGAVELPASRLDRAADLRLPSSTRASIGVERQWVGRLMSFIDYRYQRGAHLFRSRNINAPLVDGRRPFPEEGNITQLETTANAWHHQLHVGLGPAPSMSLKRVFWFFNYTWSRSINETDGAFSLPANNYQLSAERGPAADDVRHRFSGMTNLRLMKRIGLGLFFNYSSAAPYNITTGFDDNGDSTINDRPADVARNSARGAAQLDLSSRLGWGLAFGERKQTAGASGPMQSIAIGAPAGGGPVMAVGAMTPEDAKKKYRMEFYIQASNLLNRANPTGFSGVQTSPFFGRPTGAQPGRRLETGLNFSF